MSRFTEIIVQNKKKKKQNCRTYFVHIHTFPLNYFLTQTNYIDVELIFFRAKEVNLAHLLPENFLRVFISSMTSQTTAR